MLVTFFIRIAHKGKHETAEIKQSFNIPKDDEPLGEVALGKLNKKNRNN